MSVHIEVTSTLTQEDENRLAPIVMKVLSGMLDMLPVAYIVRVETADQRTLEAVSATTPVWEQTPPSAPETNLPTIES